MDISHAVVDYMWEGLLLMEAAPITHVSFFELAGTINVAKLPSQ